MMPNILGIDPGMSTGIVFGQYTDTTPFQRTAFWQVEGGLTGLSQWWGFLRWYPSVTTVEYVVEKFVPLPMARSFKLDELEPIRIEGWLAGRAAGIVWQRSSAMVLAGGDTTAQRKKNSDEVLRKMGLWTTGKEVGLKDANDVNSAQKHIVGYLKSIQHAPTLDLIGS